MFVEFTEILGARSHAFEGSPSERVVAINPQKVQAFYPQANSTNTIIQLRRDTVKVKENYEDVFKNLVYALKKTA
jgi:hypothetical protein